MRRGVDLSVYLILDAAFIGERDILTVLRAALAGGVTAVQLRDKVHDTADMIALARAIKAALPADVPLIVNDRVDVAHESGADGVHLGQEDGAVQEDAQGPRRV